MDKTIFFIIVFVCLGLSFLVYYYLPRDLKAKSRKVFFRYSKFIIVGGFLWYGWNRWGFVSDYPYIAGMHFVMFIFWFGLFLYLSVKNWLYEFRYKTNYFIANGIYGSCALSYEIGEWTILYLGTTGVSDFLAVAIPIMFPKQIVIVPTSSIVWIGNCKVSNVQVKKIAIGRVFPTIKKRIISDFRTYFARDEIYFGIASFELKFADPNWESLEQEIELTNSKYNDLEEDFDDVAVNKEKYVGHVRRVKILGSDSGRKEARGMEE